MTALSSPLVYVGPTLSEQEVRQALPGCIVRPPIARGDLYRDRLLRGSVFVILDGVFFQQRAVSPREIIDVMADGGLVIGASSLGALRAAECWPAGMRGIGSIYRLLRHGALSSDDEVAVAYDPGNPSCRSSVALVNVRYALWRGIRQRQLGPESGARILSAAQSLFYSERHWPRILRHAQVPDPEGALARELGRHDLKRLDALRALARIQRWQARTPDLCTRPRRSKTPFAPWEAERERAHDALAGRSRAEVAPELVRWLLGSGRYLHYLAILAGESGSEQRRRRRGAANDSKPDRLATVTAQQRTLVADLLLQQGGPATEQWMALLERSGELDAELFRARALRHLASQSAERGLTPTALHRHQATERMLIAHDCQSWDELVASGCGDPRAESLFQSHRDQLARALAMREHC